MKIYDIINAVSNIEYVLIKEGINDPAIFKAIFLVGGPGSGKSSVSELLGLRNLGYTPVNSDIAFEYLMKKYDLDPKMPRSQQGQRDQVRIRAKNITANKSNLALDGRLGLIFDGTGDNFEKISDLKKNVESLGYSCYLVIVNTDLRVARDRNMRRTRTVPDEIAIGKWEALQNNIGKYTEIFNYVSIIDHSYDITDPRYRKATLPQIQTAYKKIVKFTNMPNKNPKALAWFQQQQTKDRPLAELKYKGNLGVMELVKFFKEHPELKQEYNRIKMNDGNAAALKFALKVINAELEGEPYSMTENSTDGENPQAPVSANENAGSEWEETVMDRWAPRASRYMARIVKQSFNSLYPDVKLKVWAEDEGVTATTDLASTDVKADVFGQRGKKDWECNFLCGALFNRADGRKYLELMVDDASSGSYPGVWKIIIGEWKKYALSQLKKTGADDVCFSVDQDMSGGAWGKIAQSVGIKYIAHDLDEGYRRQVENLSEGQVTNTIMAFALAGGLILGSGAGYIKYTQKERWKEAYTQIKEQDPETARQIQAMVNRYISKVHKNPIDAYIDSKAIDKAITDFENKNLNKQQSTPENLS